MMITVQTPSTADSITAIIAAINTAGTGGTIFMPAGTYNISEPIVIPMGTDVIAEEGTTIVPNGDFHAVQIGANSKWQNGVINLGKAQTSAAFLVSPNMPKSGNTYALKTRISNVEVRANGNCEGIRLEITKAPSGSNVIEYCSFEHFMFTSVGTGINLVGDSTMGWINACNFNNIMLRGCLNNFIVEAGNSGHCFTGIQCQTQKGTKSIIINAGSYNRFEGMIWDMHSNIPTPTPLVIIENNSRNNIIDMNIDPKSGYVKDLGTNTQWRGIP